MRPDRIVIGSDADALGLRAKALVKQPDRRLPIRSEDLPQPLMKLLGRVKPSDAEVQANPRARSAIMRVAQRLAKLDSNAGAAR